VSLRNGASKSCGCWKAEVAGNMKRTHGMSDTPIYESWTAMRQRCLNPHWPDFHNYGGRGISICDSWASFERFFQDMGPTFQPGLTLDRIDNNGNYEPSNCRWTTYAEQNRNHRRNIWVDTPQGRMVMKDAARIAGVPYKVMKKRIQQGVSPEDLLAPAESLQKSPDVQTVNSD
jgi:hypothetical protein